MENCIENYLDESSLKVKLKGYSLYFSVMFLISSITCFFAYNWEKLKFLSNMQKMMIPMGIVILCVGGWFLFQGKELYRKIFLFIGAFSTGSIFVVFSQIYQTGADSYTLFLSWGIFILAFSFVEKFYPLWGMNVTAFTLTIYFYVREVSHLGLEGLASGFFLLGVLGIYLEMAKREKLTFNKWFFQFLNISSLGLLTTGGIQSLMESNVFTVIYILGMGINYYLEYRRTGEKDITSLQVASLIGVGIVFLYEIGIFEDFISGLAITMLILIGGIKKISKNSKNSFIGKMLIFDLMLALFVVVLLFVAYFLVMIGIDEEALFILGGVILIIFSLVCPSLANFKEDRVELISFFAGLTLITVYLNLDLELPITISVLLVWGAFGVIYVTRYFKKLDYLIIPAFIIGSYIISGYFNYLSIPLTILGVLLPFFFKDSKDRMKRIGRGGELALIVQLLFIREINQMIWFRADEVGVFMLKSVTIVSYILEVVAILLFLKALYTTIKNKKYVIITGSIFIGQMVLGLIIYTLMGKEGMYEVLENLAGILRFMYILKFLIMLLLIYIIRREKKFEIVIALSIVGVIGNYYYNTTTTLLMKSYEMLGIGIVLFIGYLLLKKSNKRIEGSEEV